MGGEINAENGFPVHNEYGLSDTTRQAVVIDAYSLTANAAHDVACVSGLLG